MGGVEDKPITTDLVSRVKQEKKKFENKYGSWRKEARENYDMVAGDGRQWPAEVRAKLEADGKPCVEFDRLGTIIDAVSGSEINNRQETTYTPRVAGSVQQQGIGATKTAAARWVRDNCDAEDEESDAFVDVLITGIGCTQTRMDYEESEEGQIVIERKDILRMGWDATATKKNNADAKCVWEECRFTREEVEARWPDKADEIVLSSGSDDEDDEDPHVVDPQTSYQGGSTSNAPAGTVDVTHFQWYEVEQVYKVLMPDGSMPTLPEDRAQMVLALYPQTQYAKIPKRRYMEAFIAGDVELEVKPGPCKHDFSFQFITGKRDRNRGYWYGLVRPGKDPQRWANKFFSQILHIINTNAKGGVLAETGAVSNVKKFEDDWAKSDSISWLNPGGLGKVQPKQPAQIPPALFQTMEFAISSIRDCTGVNLELLGLVDRQQAGVLEQQRTQAGLTILAPFFGAMRLYRKRHGRLLSYFITEYIADGRLVHVMEDGLQQFLPLLREEIDVDDEVVVDSAPTARDTKEKTWAALMPIMSIYQQQQIPPPPEVFDYLPVPLSLAQKFKQSYMEHLQKMQQPNPQQQADLRDKAASAEQKESAAALNYAKAGGEGFNLAAQVFEALTGQPLLPSQVPQPPGMQSAPQTMQ